MKRTALLLLMAFCGNQQVDASPRVLPQIGMILIEGNIYTDDRVILNELNTAGVFVGAVVSETNLAKAAEKLNARGVFDHDEPPTVTVKLGEGSDFRKLILVRVKEKRSGEFRSGPLEYRPAKPIEDAYRKLVSYQCLFMSGSDIINRPRSGVWYDPH